MLNSEKIITMIQEDAPVVYDILTGETHEGATPDELLESLTEYSGDNHDVHYWSGRYAQMIEIDALISCMLRVFEENKQKLAPLGDHDYTIKIGVLNNLQEFISEQE